MALSIIKETIELESVTADSDGNVFINKRINLKDGYRHQLLQIDMFEDAFSSIENSVETVISAYPTIPTNMTYSPASNFENRYVAAGDDSVLFKDRRIVFPNGLSDANATQFPSREIASNNKSYFYTDHIYINMHLMVAPDAVVENIAYSFMLVVNDIKCNNLEHALGVLSEQHNAMCALVMSNGRMNTITNLRGNTFPIWRYGGIRPENTISPLAANSYFLEIATRDAEEMQSTVQVRQAVADARQMSAFDDAMGLRRPDWLRFGLNQGIVAGPIRADPVPLKYADNGNTRMF